MPVTPNWTSNGDSVHFAIFLHGDTKRDFLLIVECEACPTFLFKRTLVHVRVLGYHKISKMSMSSRVNGLVLCLVDWKYKHSAYVVLR